MIKNLQFEEAMKVWVSAVLVTTNDGKIVSGSDDKTVRVGDLGLADKMVHMDEDQARALWKLFDNVVSMEDKIGQHELWKEIEKILGEDAQVARAIVNNNNE